MDEGYRNLGDVISFARFHFNVPTSAIKRQEREILEPQLIDLGYTDITWWMGEEDSFGPLSRLCRAIDKHGDEVTFIYG
jgi:hypothetical protein